MFFEYKCLGCRTCAQVCPSEEIKFSEGKPILDRSLCAACGKCAEACPTGAWVLVGRSMSVEELLSVLARDLVFFDRSEGGVTFSGGEPLAQPEFLRAALAECQARRIHTALDTSGFSPPPVFRTIAEKVDFFLFDLKLVDPVEHRRFTGQENLWIQENLAWLVESGRGKDVVIRIPVIPGITDTDHNVRALLQFLRDLTRRGGVREVQLLSYHDVREKYERLGRNYPLPGLACPSAEVLSHLRTKIGQVARCTI